MYLISLNEMYNMMKSENKAYLKMHQQTTATNAKSKTESDVLAKKSPPKLIPPQPIDKLNQLQDLVNSSLSAVIAHTGN